MIVGLREERWTVICFVAEHTHPLMEQPERVRYYRSHCSIPAEDYQLLLTLHDVNLSNLDCMGVLGRIHGGDTRILPYVKRDVTNERAKLRRGLTFRDMDMTVKYFERRKAENPEFFYAKQKDPATNLVSALFWVDGRTRALYRLHRSTPKMQVLLWGWT